MEFPGVCCSAGEQETIRCIGTIPRKWKGGWLAWATVTLANNAFGIKTHTARLKKLGISNAEILEGLAVLQYFIGISTMINGLAMAEDVHPNVLEYLRQTP